MSAKVLFFGTPDYAVPTLKALLSNSSCQVAYVITQPDRPAGRGHELTPSPVKIEALRNHLPVLQPESIKKDANFLSQLESFGSIDLGVVIAFGQIIPEGILKLPKLGCVNLHASLLPRWRGAAPIQRALLAGDKVSGVCLMQMEKGLDTGPVFSSLNLDLDSNYNFKTLHDKLATLSAELLTRDLSKILSGQLHSTPQSEVGMTYAKKVSENEALIDWSKPAEEIERQIRAFDPIPGSYTLIDGKRLKLYSPCKFTSSAALPPGRLPGEVISLSANELVIQCNQGSISSSEVQLEGKRRIKVAEFARGFTIPIGTILGR